MDKPTKPNDALVFHLTGRRGTAASVLEPVAGRGLRPAALAAYRELDRLRHDFPLVLQPTQGQGGEEAATLSSLVDAMLEALAPRGVDGERLRRQALQAEHEIRAAVGAGAGGTLGELWSAAAARVAARAAPAEQALVEQVLRHAATTLPADAEVLGCNEGMPARLLGHAWQAAQRRKAQHFHAELAPLVQKLSDILRAAHIHSPAGRQPQALQAAVGGPHQAAFDFEALSRLVGQGAPRDELPPARRARLEQALQVLQAQRFFPGATGVEPYGYAFDNCAAAAQAFRQRLPAALALVKALLVAELEVRGRYVEAEHDLYFQALDEHALTADDLARLPDYLVCIPAGRNDAPENTVLMDLLSSGLPVKVLVQTTELLEDAAIGTGHYAFGVRSARLATTAMGLGGMFVLQTACSNLHALRARVAQGLATPGPALFSVYAAPAPSGAALPPYLMAAAAMQSRGFPAFSYDAAAGHNWATRFSLENNPQPQADWPQEPLDYADAEGQRVSENPAFTFADFLLCDARYAAHFAIVPRAHWSPAMLPVAQWLTLDEHETGSQVPYLLAADAQDGLHRVVVDARLMQATRRCLLLWRRLQEHQGAPAPTAPDAQATAATADATTATATPAAADSAPAAPAAPVAAPAAATRSRDEAWIETARCPSCNECQRVNDRMFTYNERKQAYIKDITAGTYRQLVEAAEGCQVGIIHPGAPRDPDEPGLAELLARAEPFR